MTSKCTVLMIPLTSKLKLLIHTHLGGLYAGGLSDRLPQSVPVQTFTSKTTLVERTSKTRELAQRSGLPGKSRCRLLHVRVATLKYLGLIDLSHELQVHGVMPFSKFLQVFLLLQGLGAEVLHGAPGATGWCQQHLIWNFFLKSLEEQLAVLGKVKVPSSGVSKDLNFGTQALSNLGDTAFTRVDLPDHSRLRLSMKF
jgi:hypothetical protein